MPAEQGIAMGNGAADTWLARAARSLDGVLAAEGIGYEPSVARAILPQIVQLAEGPPETLTERRSEQRSRLELLGLWPAEARRVLRRLDLPGQDTPEPRVVTPGVYHPARIRQILEQNCEFQDRMAGDGDGVMAGREQIVDKALAQSLADLASTKTVPLLPGDRSLLRCGLLMTLASLARAIGDSPGCLIDAEGILGTSGAHVPSVEDFSGMAAGSVAYVHFGRDALPSPYPGLGIEGSYVVRRGGGSDGEFVLIPVVSDPRIRGAGPDEITDKPLSRVLQDHGRGWIAVYDDALAPCEESGLPSRGIKGKMDRAWRAIMPRVLGIVAEAMDEMNQGRPPYDG